MVVDAEYEEGRTAMESGRHIVGKICRAVNDRAWHLYLLCIGRLCPFVYIVFLALEKEGGSLDHNRRHNGRLDLSFLQLANAIEFQRDMQSSYDNVILKDKVAIKSACIERIILNQSDLESKRSIHANDGYRLLQQEHILRSNTMQSCILLQQQSDQYAQRLH